MIPRIQPFVFNGFGVNTYVLSDDSNQCIIVDAACVTDQERSLLKDFIDKHNLKPLWQISTHTHVDHIAGCAFVKNTWQIPWLLHPDAITLLNQAPMYASMFGISLDHMPEPDQWLADNDVIQAGDMTFKILHCPGHAPGSVCLYTENLVITGDVLFNGSIGRSDLPGGDFDLLLKSIAEKLLNLPDETIVYPGHGPATSIGEEKLHNPFL